jgi:hypothetical protein
VRFPAWHRQEKNPAGVPPGFNVGVWELAPARGPRGGNALSSLRFPLLAAAVLAGFFVALLELQALEKPVILNLLLQNAHGFFDVIVNDFDLDFLQQYRPFRAAGTKRWSVFPPDILTKRYVNRINTE